MRRIILGFVVGCLVTDCTKNQIELDKQMAATSQIPKTSDYTPNNVPAPYNPPTQFRYNQNNSGEYYANCSEARAFGNTPIYEGEDGYRPGLDRDDDGVACE
ncbi:MAG: hypothetical protein FD163_2522 [Hyphomonadaceae bacterium]|nr:MAG: hypothetical protein FD128_745 [Hyphomonadaceae bacterium]KAF0182732.1 MAG: hypothetical protein FD163_2522 [Hyphomonadaceae bacterium]